MVGYLQWRIAVPLSASYNLLSVPSPFCVNMIDSVAQR